MALASTAASGSELPDEFDENKPLWKYITKLAKPGEGGGNYQLQCSFCNQTFKGSYTRVKAHLLKLPGKGIGACKKVSSQKLAQMQKENDEAELRIKNAQQKKVPFPPSMSMAGSYTCDLESKKRKVSQVGSGSGSRTGSAVEKAFNMKDRDQLHAEIARMYYSGG